MKHGFTLIELMTTLVIALILSCLALNTYQAIVQAQSLTGAAQIIFMLLEEAHETAQTGNHPVEIRFYNLKTSYDPLVAYRMIQAHVEMADGSTPALAAPSFLPQNVVLDTTPSHSPLLCDATLCASPDSSDSHLNGQTRAFHFMPDGTTDLDPNKSWFVTARMETASDPAHFPANWACIQIEAATGRAKIYRP